MPGALAPYIIGAQDEVAEATNLRDISDVYIPPETMSENLKPDKRVQLVDKVLTDIVNRIAKADLAVISKMTNPEVERYLAVELWVALDEWEDQLIDSDEHGGDPCPICDKAMQVAYCRAFLEHRWRIMGKEQFFKNELKFRCTPIPERGKFN